MPKITGLAERFFGIQYDERQRLFIEDGREFLERRQATSPYDFIFVDVFRGMGFSPPHVATAEFYALCKRHLKPGGVVAVNLVETDSVFGQRVATWHLVSNRRTCSSIERSCCSARIVRSWAVSGILQRAAALQAEHCFSFPFVERAATVKPLRETDGLRALSEKSAVLADDANVAESLPLLPTDPLFYRVGRNDPCPCGSGKKFKRCHGRV